MPAYANTLTPDDLNALVAFLQSGQSASSQP
jgi:hypothetical protein